MVFSLFAGVCLGAFTDDSEPPTGFRRPPEKSRKKVQ